MKTKSCLVQVIILIVLVILVGVTVKRCLSAPAPDETAAPSTPAKKATAISDKGLLLTVRKLFARDGTPLPATEESPQRIEAARAPHPMPTGPTGIEGLFLRSVRPILFDVPRVRGLAVGDSFVYITSYDDDKRVGLLYRIDARTLEVREERPLCIDERYRLGGIALGQGRLWTCLSGQDESSAVVTVDPVSLDAQVQLLVQDALRAVAVGEDGRIYAVNDDSSRFYVFSPDGHLLEAREHSTGARYTDMAMVRGSLVCAGKTPDKVGVIDVLDPDQLTLLARHLAYARSPQGRLVTSNGFAVSGQLFCFMPDRGQNPMLLVYELEQVSLEDYVPSLARY